MRQEILNILPVIIRQAIEELELEFKELEEIRVRCGRFITLFYKGEEILINQQYKYKIQREHMREILEYISQYSLYAYEEELKQGYITIEGGHRVGLAGKTVIENQRVKTIKWIHSMNIRVAHEVIGCANPIVNHVYANNKIRNTLIISPPRCGKTTILRDLIRQLSNGNSKVIGHTIGVVDERSELGACYQGIPQNDLGCRTDILDGCPKVEGMMMLVRSMSPQIIAVDEIGMKEDIDAIEYVSRCGCHMLASIHGTTLDEIKEKPILNTLLDKKIFERYIVLANQPKVGSIRGVYDGNGVLLYQDSREHIRTDI